LIVVKEFKGDITDLQVGQVITYYSYQRLEGGYGYIFNTHRIAEISGNTVIVVGDNPALTDKKETVHISNVVATWGTPTEKGKDLGSIGEFVYKLQNDRVVYFCAIVLPLIILFVIYAFILIRTLIINKIDATKKEAAAQSAVGLSEEDKEALRKEYLASLAAETARLTEDDEVTDGENAEDDSAENLLEDGQDEKSDKESEQQE
ncbi:MAG: hypothetical protein MJ193_03835, partial [Clostridia bacterium]|nr:hypothetical protein [Clostridia bacterium]